MNRVRCLVLNAALGPLDYKVPEGMDVVVIDVGDVSTVNFTLPEWSRAKLVGDGRVGVKQFILGTRAPTACDEPETPGPTRELAELPLEAS